jgi:hypothetical protein
MSDEDRPLPSVPFEQTPMKPTVEERLARVETLVGAPWPPEPGDRFPPPQTLFEALRWIAGQVKLFTMMRR